MIIKRLDIKEQQLPSGGMIIEIPRYQLPTLYEVIPEPLPGHTLPDPQAHYSAWKQNAPPFSRPLHTFHDLESARQHARQMGVSMNLYTQPMGYTPRLLRLQRQYAALNGSKTYPKN